MIRRANSNDARDCTQLIYMSGPKLFHYFFSCDERRVIALLMMLFEKPDTIFSKDFLWVDEKDGKVRGSLLLFPGKCKSILERNIKHYGKEIARIVGLMRSMKILCRVRLYRFFPEIGQDELYIEALAVYPEYRGQKIGSGLLKKSFECCKTTGLHKVSLLVENNNAFAIRMYKKYGFEITDTSEFKKSYHKHHLYGLHKMVKKE